ncbi:hypothetical protein GF351_05360 [Candidatus Woesearchaeota archaeon]|nr:hypothetical protein [Candidatus Woesearchaeota archaeon]
MADPLIYLTYVAIILLIGIICSLISRKLGIPNILLLLLAGIGLNNIYYRGEQLIDFPPVFLTSIAILALVMIVFDSTSRFKIKEFDTFSLKVLKLTGIFLFCNLALFTFFTKWIFQIQNVLLCLIFSAMMAGTSPDAVMTVLGGSKNKVIEFLEIESILNTPMIVLLPFIFLDLMQTVAGEIVFEHLLEQILPFLLQITAGIGSGVLVGLVIFKGMRKKYSETVSPLAIITAALISYILAENLGGNGVLSVTTMGLFFGNIYVKEKAQLQEFSSMFTSALEIIVFILVGLTIKLPLDMGFYFRSLMLFAIYLIIRLTAIEIGFRKEFTFKEKIFMTLNVQKGIAVAVIAFTLVSYSITRSSVVVGLAQEESILLTALPGVETVLNLILIFMLYSIILSTVISKFSKRFISVQLESAKEK